MSSNCSHNSLSSLMSSGSNILKVAAIIITTGVSDWMLILKPLFHRASPKPELSWILKALRRTPKCRHRRKTLPRLVVWFPSGFVSHLLNVFGFWDGRLNHWQVFVWQNRSVELLIRLWLQQWDLRAGFVYAMKSQGGVSEFDPCGCFSWGRAGGCEMTKDIYVEENSEFSFVTSRQNFWLSWRVRESQKSPPM